MESRGRIAEQQPSSNQALPTIQPKDEFKIRLARDLAYTGIGTNDAILENFIYEELKKRLGAKTAHVRKSTFTPKSVYTTKKLVRKVVPSKASSKLVQHCSACREAGHTKVNCPRLKRAKKVNHVYQDEIEDPEDSEDSEECIMEEDSEEEEIEDDDEYNDDNESTSSRNCYAVKKSGAKWSTYEKERSNQEVPYFQVSC